MRNTTILTALLALAVPAVAPAATRPVRHRTAAVQRPSSAAAVAALRPAFQFAFPVYAMMQARAATLAKAQAYGIDGMNRLFVRASLADATTREVTTPNNDTLYASAWLDLSHGPLRFTLPATPRYHSAALMNVFTDVVALAGSRDGNGGGGDFLIAGPGFSGDVPAGVKLLQSDTNDAWLLVRMLVTGPDDVAAAAAVLRSATLAPAAMPATPTRAVPTADPDATTFLDVVNEALGRTPLPPAFAGRAAALAVHGIRPGVTGAFALLPAAERARWTAALPLLRRELAGGVAATGTSAGGWSYSAGTIGNFGSDDANRARVALGGLGALPRSEAVYLSAAADAAGAPLDGSHAYIAHIPANLPVGAFWSLTMYRVEPDGRLFIAANALNRFALGDRTGTLHAERDGSFDIFVQAAAPSGERVVNWLPAPAGPFRLVFRAYLPKDGLLDGSFRVPPVVAAEPVP